MALTESTVRAQVVGIERLAVRHHIFHRSSVKPSGSRRNWWKQAISILDLLPRSFILPRRNDRKRQGTHNFPRTVVVPEQRSFPDVGREGSTELLLLGIIGSEIRSLQHAGSPNVPILSGW